MLVVCLCVIYSISCLLGLVQVEATVTAIVEIIHSFLLSEPSLVSLASNCYAQLLLCQVQY